MKYIKVTPVKKGKSSSVREKRKWLWEFSKKIVVTVTVIFVAAFLFSCILLCVYPDSTALQSVIDNISSIFKVTVVSYAVKAGFENVTKIKKNNQCENCFAQEEQEENLNEEEVYSDTRGIDS